MRSWVQFLPLQKKFFFNISFQDLLVCNNINGFCAKPILILTQKMECLCNFGAKPGLVGVRF